MDDSNSNQKQYINCYPIENEIKYNKTDKIIDK